MAPGRRLLRFARLLAAAAVMASSAAHAADFRVTGEAPTLLYDAPSAKARPLFIYGRDVPVEVLVSVEGWTKVRDVGGAISPRAANEASSIVVAVELCRMPVMPTPAMNPPMRVRA